MTRLWWVRHGPTHAKAMVGWSDIAADLSDAAAIARLSAYLPAGAPVISSDLKRAVDTASAIASGRSVLPPDPRLREINFGAWEMKRFDEVGDAARPFWEEPGDHAPPEGESWHQTSARVSEGADALVREYDGDVIVVAHFGAILTQVARARQIDGKTAFAQKIDNLSVTRLSFDGQWQAHEINHCP